MNRKLNFLDLFAAAGGLSEGFIRAGLEPVAHVESHQAAPFPLRTRLAYHWLKAHGRTGLYADYLNGGTPPTVRMSRPRRRRRRARMRLVVETSSVAQGSLRRTTLPAPGAIPA